MGDGVRIYKNCEYPDPGGFVILPRRAFREDPLLEIKPWHPWILWQFIIYLCVWDKAGRTISREGHIIHLERGQAFYSLRFLGEAAGYGKDRVAGWLQRFSSGVVPGWAKEGPRIRHEPLHKGTLLTVLNYDPYQDINFYAETPDQTRNQTAEQAQRARENSQNRSADQTRNQTQARQTPDTGQTNKNAVSMQCEQLHARARGTDEPDTQTVSWKDIQASRNYGLWPSIPIHVRHTMLVDALASHIPPNDLVPWVLDEINLLEIPVDIETYRTLQETADMDRDNPASDQDYEQQLREKLRALASTRK